MNFTFFSTGYNDLPPFNKGEFMRSVLLILMLVVISTGGKAKIVRTDRVELVAQ